MIYYSSNNEPLIADDYTCFNNGGTSVIYKKGDELFKVYKNDAPYKSRIKKNMFEYIRQSNIPNLVKLIDFYFEIEGILNKILPIDAYTMEQISGEMIELLTADKQYIELILNQLEETLEKLSEYKIIIEDSHKGNIIFNKNGVHIIDLDSFWHSKIIYTKKEIYYLNKCRLLYSISAKINSELEKEKSLKRVVVFKWNRNTSITEDFSDFLTEDTLQETIKKYNLRK